MADRSRNNFCDRLGLGRKLAGSTIMQATTTWLIGQGITSVIVWVLAENWPARRFYEALGGQYFAQRSTDIAGSPLPEVSYRNQGTHLGVNTP